MVPIQAHTISPAGGVLFGFRPSVSLGGQCHGYHNTLLWPRAESKNTFGLQKRVFVEF